MLRYLVDSTAVWRLQRDPALSRAWEPEINLGSVGSCHPQRTEFRRSARNLDEYDQMTDMFGDLYPDAPVPKNAWRWIETAQYRLAQRGRHQSLSVVDWLICATAAHHGLILLHDDKDFGAAASLLPDLSEHNVYNVPRPPASSSTP
ncbi:PIN domain-containing protein [Streptomyces sp. NPDC126499]|uniref:PIN domain-containing protein n=1 Tax=Streptomyces sp. NPDC126499 TaxID=3155314 RepID=UPI00332FDD61